MRSSYRDHHRGVVTSPPRRERSPLTTEPDHRPSSPDRAEAALRALSERLERTQSLAQLGDFEWDLRTDAVMLSPGLQRIHGVPVDPTPVGYRVLLARIHPDDRDEVRQRHRHALATGEPYFMTERILTPGGDVRVLDTSAVVIHDDQGRPTRLQGVSVDVTGRSRIEAALRDSMARTARMAEESARLELGLQDAHLRRRQALQINDNIIQGLAAAALELESAHPGAAARYVQQTLEAARRMMADLLAPLEGTDLDPADLVRDEPPPATGAPPSPGRGPASTEDRVGVLLVDDAEDLRMLLRMGLERDGRFHVVAEAADGLEAIDRAAATQPDVILLDVAMPRLDGLGALPRLAEVAPAAVVIVLSGFGSEQLSGRAIAAGAAAYVEKGRATRDIAEVVLRHLPQQR